MSFFSHFISTALAANITINSAIPGNASPDSLVGIIQNFYTFALAIAGILAFGAIVYGGIRYTIGKGNPSSESEGKSWITNALIGLLLLAAAYVILYTVNPQITKLALPPLPTLGAAATLAGTSNTGATSATFGNGPLAPPTSANPNIPTTCSSGCPSGTACQINADNSSWACISTATKCGGNNYGSCVAGQCIKPPGADWTCDNNRCGNGGYGICQAGFTCQPQGTGESAWGCISVSVQCGKDGAFGSCGPGLQCLRGAFGSYSCVQ